MALDFSPLQRGWSESKFCTHDSLFYRHRSKMAQCQPLMLNSTTRACSSLPPLSTRHVPICGRTPPLPSSGRFLRTEQIRPMSRFRFLCRTNNSDITSQLELGKPDGKHTPRKQVNGTFWILLLNLGVYVADHCFLFREIKMLYLYHASPTWYQFMTSIFCHANWNHLCSNLFFLYIFGKLIEEEEGNLAVWTSYILTGVGANLVSWLVLPRNAVSIGASGAVFGLFAISVLVKIRWDWRNILEVLILGQFVIQKVMEAAQASVGMSGSLSRGSQIVNHIAHLSGALVGVALVWLISRIPSPPSDHDMSSSKQIKRI